MQASADVSGATANPVVTRTDPAPPVSSKAAAWTKVRIGRSGITRRVTRLSTILSVLALSGPVLAGWILGGPSLARVNSSLRAADRLDIAPIRVRVSDIGPARVAALEPESDQPGAVMPQGGSTGASSDAALPPAPPSTSVDPNPIELAAAKERSRPNRATGQAVPETPAPAVEPAPAAAQPPASEKVPPAPAMKPGDAPADAASAPPEQPQTWSEAEITAALRACVRLLASIVAEVEPQSPVKSGQCGTPAPILLKRLGASGVELKPPAMMSCNVAVALHTWIEHGVQPLARELLSSPVVKLIGTQSYVCRNRNNQTAGPMSEHAFGNAVDVLGFVLADGRTINVLDGWGTVARDNTTAPEGTKDAEAIHPEPKIGKLEGQNFVADAGRRHLSGPQAAKPLALSPKDTMTPEGRFLRRIHADACGNFRTVLGPEANDAHRNHFHFDLKVRKGRAFCQ